jgi:diguanylate cyclase (GGDEF)-like protein/PAS domain S-box-containing protein
MARREALWRRPELQAVTDYAEDFIQIFDLEFRQLFVNRSLAQALQKRPEDFLGRTLPETGINAEVTALWHDRLQRVKDSGTPQKFEFVGRTRDGKRTLQTQLAPVRDATGKLSSITAITRDITEWKRAEMLHQGQHEVMRQLAAGASLDTLLTTIIRLVEAGAPGRVCSILLLAPDGRHLARGHAPSMPRELVDAICARPIGPDNGTCGVAAHTRSAAVAADIATDPAWKEHRDLAMSHKLKACWSHPILAEDGALRGTFTMYHRRARPPFPIESRLVAEAALMASIAIGHWRTQETLLETRDRFQVITEYAANMVAVTDMEGRIRYVSPSCERMLGFRPEELLGNNLYLGVHREDVPAATATYRKLRDEVGAQEHAMFRYRHKDGSWRILEVDAKSRFDHHGEYIAVVSGRDVTEREEATRALHESEDRLDRALEATDLGMWEWEVDSGQFHIDERFARALGYEPGALDLTYEKLTAIIHPDDALRIARVTEAHLRGEAGHLDYQGRVMTQDGRWTWIHSRGKAIRDQHGTPWRVSGTVRNVDAERAMEERLAQADTQMKLLMEATDEGIVGLDGDGVITFVNPAAVRMLGVPEAQLLGQNFDERVRHTTEDGTDLIGHDSPIVHCLLEGQRYVGANELFWRDAAHAVPVEYSVSPVLRDGRPGGAVLIFRDVSEKRTLAQQLQHQALHDPLTGLINRRGFEKRLAALLQSARSQGREHALCYLDLDQFKLVNDTCGHAAGDELLRQLPQVLAPLVRRSDTIARLGGDEFALLLEDCQMEQAARIAQSVRDTIRDFRFVWQQRTFTIGASIGVVAVNSSSQGLVSVLGAADAACYVAKDQGPNHVHVSYPHDLAIIRRRGEMRWVSRIRSALEEDQFRLHYMSIAPLDGSAPPQHHELLLRLLDGKGDLVLPGQFMQAAERYQLMPQIDHWVVDHALRQLGGALAAAPALRGHCFGINLSGESLRDPHLLEFIQRRLAESGVPPSMIYFELTETAAIANLAAAVEFMRGLKQTGCLLALDDFGSGMSSFSYLKHLPVDFLKIDGSFIKDLVSSPVDQAIVRAVQAVGTQMGIRTIAEYVASDTVRACLRDMGIHYGQGYAIAMPAPLEEFPLLRARGTEPGTVRASAGDAA